METYDVDYYDWAMLYAPAAGGASLSDLRYAYFRGVKDCREGWSYPYRDWLSQAMQEEYEVGFYTELWEQSE